MVPRRLAYLHPRYKTPVYLLMIFYLIGLIPILFDFSMGTIASVVLLLAYSFKIVLAYKVLDLPKLFPQQYAESPYRVSPLALRWLIALSVSGITFQCYLLLSRASAFSCGDSRASSFSAFSTATGAIPISPTQSKPAMRTSNRYRRTGSDSGAISPRCHLTGGPSCHTR
ncbi:hypothetical protein N4G58_19200 [Edwardsiella piscicida]|nr:hypothetical protein N4G58_19200 [Edwardsiella piscicida]